MARRGGGQHGCSADGALRRGKVELQGPTAWGGDAAGSSAPLGRSGGHACRGIIPLPRLHRHRRRRDIAAAMASDNPNPIVLGCGGISVDYLAMVASFPNPDDKIRSLELKVQGGGNTGNTGNALTAAACLGLRPRIISKVANDAQGKNILSELQADGIDTTYMLVAENGNSPFTYIIVDEQTKTRTCIHHSWFSPLGARRAHKGKLVCCFRWSRHRLF